MFLDFLMGPILLEAEPVFFYEETEVKPKEPKKKDYEFKLNNFTNAMIKGEAAVYLAHPYSGNEEKNIALAEEKAAILSKKYPEITFFNPLNAMKHLRRTDMTYEDILAQCLVWLRKCDGLILLKGWNKSVGCQVERAEAISRWMPVWEGANAFDQAMSKFVS